MGVRGLSTYVDDNKNLFLSDYKLHDTKVIIDGSNLFHFLYYHYNVSYQFGGDYDRFARKCKRFFNILKDCSVTPVVVFDGGYNPDDRKLATVLERANERRKRVGLVCSKGRGCVLPILSYETFLQVLVELEVAHVSCIYEADREIAVLAKKWKCPVLSNDSDFFIYQLEGGFIPLDYINMTLCLYDSQKNIASVLERKTVVGESQFVYIPVKYYNCERFLKLFKKDDNDYVLPLLGTLLGNDYVEISVLYSFYQSLRAPKCPSKKLIKTKASTRMEAVLHWVDNTENEEEALELILEGVAKEKRENLREVLVKSVSEYKDIDNFDSFDLEHFVTNVQNGRFYITCENVYSECIETVESKISDLTDYYDRNLPQWFIRKLRSCEMNGSFLQNVCVNHRVVFNCQVEMLREISSYTCSRNLRSVIYGIVLNPLKCDASDKPSQNNNVVEFDRKGKNTKKFFVQPVDTLPGVSELPTLQTVPSLSEGDRRNILYAAFGVTSESLEKNVDEASQLFTLVLRLWINNAEPKVSESHLSALLICVIALHLKQLDWLAMKKASGLTPFEPKMYPDIVKACTEMGKERIEAFKRYTEKHFKRPELSSKIPRDNKVVHGYAQFQACFLDTRYFNQVLMNPICIPSPSMILNCTFVYNLCRDLEGRPCPERFCADILGKDSPLHSLFLSWKQSVISLCRDTSFDGGKRKMEGLKKKSKSRTKAKKSKKEECSEQKNDWSLSEEEVGETMTLNCDVSNKFSLLGLQDS